MKLSAVVVLLAVLAPALVRAEPVTLDVCLQEVFANNPDILAARADLDRAAGQRLVYNSRGLPRLKMDTLVGYQGDRGVGGAATAIVVGHADLAQPLFEAGIPAARRRGKLEVTIAQQTYYQVATERLYQARVQFLQILARQRAGDALREIQAALIANQDAQDDLLRAGLASRMTQLQARVQRLGIEPDLAEADGAARRGMVVLRQLMGRATGKPDPEPRGSLEFQDVSLDLRSLTAEALRQRPDLAALRGLVSASVEDQRIIEAGYYPLIEARVGVTGVPPANRSSASSNPNALRSIDSNLVNEFRYGVFLSWVIDNGVIVGQSRAIGASTDSLRIALARAEADVPRDLARLRATMTANSQRRASYAVAGTAGDETLRTVTGQIRAGTASQVAFANAQSSLLDARVGAVIAAADQALAFAELDRIAGRYLRFIPTSDKDARASQPK
jgi:outer membrane protein TolC